MLFRNLKTGNLVEAKHPGTVDIMRQSPLYEEYTPKPAAAKRAGATQPAAKSPAKRPAPKKTAKAASTD